MRLYSLILGGVSLVVFGLAGFHDPFRLTGTRYAAGIRSATACQRGLSADGAGDGQSVGVESLDEEGLEPLDLAEAEYLVMTGDGRLAYALGIATKGSAASDWELVSFDLERLMADEKRTCLLERATVRTARWPKWAPALGPIACSGDGSVVAYSTLVEGDLQLAVWDRDARVWGVEHCLLTRNSRGKAGSGSSFGPSVSADGAVLAFCSEASDLVSGDGNNACDVFVARRSSGDGEGSADEGVTVARASVDMEGNEADGDSGSPFMLWGPALSPDGGFVAFVSSATNLVPDDSNGSRDVFLKSLADGNIWLVGRESGGGAPGWTAEECAVSKDAQFVVFTAKARGVASGYPQVYVWDRESGSTHRISRAVGGGPMMSWCSQPVVSWDGRFVVFGVASLDQFGIEEVSEYVQLVLCDRDPDEDGNYTPGTESMRVLAVPNRSKLLKDAWAYRPAIGGNGELVGFLGRPVSGEGVSRSWHSERWLGVVVRVR